jgi:uncharacterized membrane protein YdfJ with MMPL/SSD domain
VAYGEDLAGWVREVLPRGDAVTDTAEQRPAAAPDPAPSAHPVAAIVLLFHALNSVALPVLSVARNMASVIEAFGVVWIFQDGHLSGPFGFTVTGRLQPSIVILAVLFGLATDYQVFLLARIREAWLETGDNAGAVTASLQHTGGIIITAAALLPIVVAAGLSSGQIVIAKTIAVGMTVALIIDASLVRVLLTPALMRLPGRLPQPLAEPRARCDDRRLAQRPESSGAVRSADPT